MFDSQLEIVHFRQEVWGPKQPSHTLAFGWYEWDILTMMTRGSLTKKTSGRNSLT